MVRAAIVAFALTPSFAEDVYYHTQLLQTKMNPQKVAVSVDGDVKDDMVLFQKTFKLGKKTVSEKFMAALKARKMNAKKARQRSSSHDPFGPPPPEAAEECKVYYGSEVDVGMCWECSMTALMSCDEAAWHPDPNLGLRALCDKIDGCMGQQNVLTETCEGEYGEDVGLLDCLMCGTVCECETPSDCDLVCHRGCMQMDEAHWEEEKSWDTEEFDRSTSDGGPDDECYEHCKDFYGPDADYDKCMAAGEKCFPKAMEATPPDSVNLDKNFFDTMLSCCDEVMGETNGVTKICQEHYGEDVEVIDCFACGMACGCETDKADECDGECHYSCMTEPSHLSANMSHLSANMKKQAALLFQKHSAKKLVGGNGQPSSSWSSSSSSSLSSSSPSSSLEGPSSSSSSSSSSLSSSSSSSLSSSSPSSS